MCVKPLMLTLVLIQATAEPDFLVVFVILTQLENKLYEAHDSGLLTTMTSQHLA